MSNVQKMDQMRYEECQKQQQLEEYWQHKQLEMQEEEQKLAAENQVWHTLGDLVK